MNKKHTLALRLTLAAAAIAALVVLVLTGVIDLEAIQEWMQGLNPIMLVVLMALLPLVGFSISVVYLVAGAVFGAWGGLAVVTGVTAFHLVTGHWLGRKVLRRPVESVLRRRKIHVPPIPEGEERSLAVVAVLTPGPPYFLRNYVLALSGIPLGTYFMIGWPIYVLRSCIVIFLGDVGSHLTLERLLLVGSIFMMKVGICAWILYRMRRRYRATHPHSHPHAASRLAESTRR